MIHFPFSDYWGFYLGFSVFIVMLLVLDLKVFHKKAHAVKFRESLTWSIVWILLALGFCGLFYYYSVQKFSVEIGKSLAIEFLTGYIVEKSLAIDNIFIFVVIFKYFKVPNIYQHRVLFWGIFGALLFRGIFIALGSILMQYEWVIWLFGGFLIFSGIKMLIPEKEGDEGEKLKNSHLVHYLNKVLPIHPTIEGEHFFLRKNGKLFVTPMFIALIVLEFSDILFAFDSVPAIFAITKEPLVVFTSNIFAILGLRSLYSLLAGSLDHFEYIKYGLAGIMIFVGLKMTYLNHLFEGGFPIGWSLSIIVLMLGISMLFSVLKSRKA